MLSDISTKNITKEDEMEKKESLVLGVVEVAALLGMSARALRMRLHRGVGAPLPTRLGGRLAWRIKDVESWLEVQAITSGAAYYSAQDSDPRCTNNQTQQNSGRRRGRPRKGNV